MTLMCLHGVLQGSVFVVSYFVPFISPFFRLYFQNMQHPFMIKLDARSFLDGGSALRGEWKAMFLDSSAVTQAGQLLCFCL